MSIKEEYFVEPQRDATIGIHQQCRGFLNDMEAFFGPTSLDKLKKFAELTPDDLMEILDRAHESVFEPSKRPTEFGDGEYVTVTSGILNDQRDIVFLPPMLQEEKRLALSELCSGVNNYAQSALANGIDPNLALKRISTGLSIGLGYIHYFPDGNGRSTRLIAASTTGIAGELKAAGDETSITNIIDGAIHAGYRLIQGSDAIDDDLYRNFTSNELGDYKNDFNDIARILNDTNKDHEVMTFILTADREPVTNYFLSIMKKEIPDLPAYEPDVKQLIAIWYQAQQMPVKSIAHELNNPGRADILKMHGDFISARIFNARNFTPNIGNSTLEGNQTFRIAE